MRRKNSFTVLITGVVFAFVMFAAGVLMISPPLPGRNEAASGIVSSEQPPLSLTPGDGNGTVQNPYVLGTPDNINTLLRNNAGTANKHFILMDNIDLASFTNWTPISVFAAGGSLDGNGFTIKNLTTARSANNIGLFDDLRGITIKNLVFENAQVNFSGTTARTYGGTVAARITSGANVFENIIVEAGSNVNGTKTAAHNTLGGLVGATTGGNATFDRCLNGANVSGSHYLGGMISRATGSNSNVVIKKCGNTGNVTSTSTSNGYSGGLMAISEGISDVTIEWSFNTGTITATRGYTAGLLGSAYQGSAIIRNSINDSAVTVTSGTNGALTTINTAGVEIQNSWFNSTLYTGNITGGTAAVVNSGGKTTTQLRNLDFLATVNGSNTEGFVLRLGQISLSLFVPTYTYTFESGEGSGETIVITQSIDELDVVLPYENLPTRIGYVFSAWNDGTSDYEAGPLAEPYTNETSANVTFTAVYEKITYSVGFASDTDTQGRTPKLTNTSSNNEFEIDDAELKLVAEDWNANFVWLVQQTAGDGWTNLGSDQPLDLSAWIQANGGWETFIIRHANANDEIIVRAVNIATSTMITISGDTPDGGMLKYSYTTGSETVTATVALGSRISIPNTATQITRLEAVANDYYSFESFQLIDNTDSETFTPAGGILDTSEDPLFDLSGARMQGFTIKVNFTPTVYEFNVKTSFAETKPVSQLVEHNGAAQSVSLGGDVAFEATALDAVEGYRFVGWKVQVFDGSQNVYANYPKGETVFELTMDSIDIIFLMQYILEGETEITIVAEYVATHDVSVFIESGQSSFGNLEIIIVDGITGERWDEDRSHLDRQEVPAGTVIEVHVFPTELYAFDRLLTKIASDTEIQTAGAYALRITVTDSREIIVLFKNKAFNIVFEAREGQNEIRSSDVQYQTTVNGAVNTLGKITMGDILNGASIVGDASLAGYRHVNFTVKNAQGGTIGLDNAILAQGISMQLMTANFNLANEFVITANYVPVWTLTVTIAENSTDMGTFKINDSETPVTTFEGSFDMDKTVSITAIPKSYHLLRSDNPFIGAIPTEISTDNPNKVTIASTRSIIIVFVPQTFNLATDLEAGDGDLTAGTTTGLQLNNTVTLTASPPGGKVISGWTINRKTVEELKAAFPNDVEVSDNEVKITLSANWLENNDFELTSEVTFKLSTAVLLAIILPSVLIPLLAAATAFYFIRSKKKYASVKAELVKETQTKRAFNPTEFIKDLKEGKGGEPTKDDVKKAMKKKTPKS